LDRILFESKYPDFHTINLIYLSPLRNYERCTITVASVTITNSIRTLVYHHYSKIKNIKYLVANEYSSLNPALFSIVLDEFLPDNIQVLVDYSNRIYFQSNEPFNINSMSYSMSLLCGIKRHFLPVSSIELEIEQITVEEDWDLIEIIKVYVIKMPNYGDYNSTLVLYLLSKLGSNFYVQTHVDNGYNNKDNFVMNNININNINNLVAKEYSSLNPALFSIVLDECLLDNIQVQLDYCNRIYIQSNEPFNINSVSYSMSLLCGIK
jgi:hypothetical protein